MSYYKQFYALSLLILLFISTASADCPETASGHHTFIGVDTQHSDSRNLDLIRASVVWVPSDDEYRYRYQYVIAIDWKSKSITNVDVWDGEKQAIVARDIFPVLLADDSDFDSGQIHLITCKPVLSTAGDGAVLVFAYYGKDGVVDGSHTRVASLLGDTAVINRVFSNAIMGTFNASLAANMIRDIEFTTGEEPPHYLAQSLLFQNLGMISPIESRNQALFFDAENAVVLQNRVYITGDNASAVVPLSIGGVFSDGLNILGAQNRASNLEQFVGTVQINAKWRNGWFSHTQLIEARAEIKVTTTACEQGYTTLSAEFLYPSDLPGGITLYAYSEEEEGVAFIVADQSTSINEIVSCDYDYRLYASRYFENHAVKSAPIWVPVATKGTLVNIEYLVFRGGLGDFAEVKLIKPSTNSVLKVWEISDLDSLAGTHVFVCDPAGDAVVDSIDEIAENWATLLTPEEQSDFGPYADEELNHLAWEDGNGDGSICDSGEAQAIPSHSHIVQITLAIYPSDH